MCLAKEFAPGTNPPGEPCRYTVDAATGEVTETRLAVGLDMDFPIVPPHLLTQPAKYMYMSGSRAESRRHGAMCAALSTSDLSDQRRDVELGSHRSVSIAA